MGIEINMTEDNDAIVITSPDGKKGFLVTIGNLIDGKEFEGNLIIVSDNYVKTSYHEGYEQNVVVLSQKDDITQAKIEKDNRGNDDRSLEGWSNIILGK